MHISSYQMHNVLNVYSKQLSQNGPGDKIKIQLKKKLADQINISLEGRRKATIEKVAKDIVDRISRLGKSKSMNRSFEERSPEGRAEENDTNTGADNQFVFNFIDDVDTKKTSTLSVEDTKFLMNRLEQLAKEAVVKKGGNINLDSRQIEG